MVYPAKNISPSFLFTSLIGNLLPAKPMASMHGGDDGDDDGDDGDGDDDGDDDDDSIDDGDNIDDGNTVAAAANDDFK